MDLLDFYKVQEKNVAKKGLEFDLLELEEIKNYIEAKEGTFKDEQKNLECNNKAATREAKSELAHTCLQLLILETEFKKLEHTVLKEDSAKRSYLAKRIAEEE